MSITNNSNTVNTTTVYDQFGIKEIYKTKQNEISWIMNDTASNSDLTIHDLTSKVTKQTDRGFPYFTASVKTTNMRSGTDTYPSFKFDIRPSGVTPGNQKYNYATGSVENGYLFTENDIGDAEFTFIARRRTVRSDDFCQFNCRGGDHVTDSTYNASSFAIKYPTNTLTVGLTNQTFHKELINTIVDTLTSYSKVNTPGWPADKWMGFKAVTYSMIEDKSQVMNRLYYDPDPIDFTSSPPRYRNNWILVSEYIDKKEVDTGNYNTVVNWKGCTWTVKIDNSDFIDFAGVSLRSIEPILNDDTSPGDTGGSGGYGGGDTTATLDIASLVTATGIGGGTTVTGQVDTSIIIAPPLSNNFIDNGGPLINKLDVYYIFWGSEWNTLSTPYSKAQLDTAMQTVFGSPYFDSLIQYRIIKRPVNRGSVINATFAKVDQYDESDAKALIDNCKTKGLIPSTVVTETTLFMIITPANFYRLSAGIRGYTYGAGTPGNYNFGFVDFQNTLASQESSMINVVVDFMVNNNPVGAGRGFIVNPNGDFKATPTLSLTEVCAATATVSGITVPQYWSNEANGCVAPAAYPTFVSCQTGNIWDPINQACKIDTSGGGGGGGGGGVPTPGPEPVFVPSILATPKGSETIDKGGYIAKQLNVYLIFWGTYWNSGTPLANKTAIIAGMTKLFGSKFFDHIYQYRRTKRPLLKDTPTNITYATVNNYTAINATALIDDCKANNQIATNFDPTNSFFIIFNPSGIVKASSPTIGYDHYKDTYYWGFINTKSTVVDYTLALSNLIVNTATDTDPLKGIVLKSNTRFPGHTAGVDELTEICVTQADVVGVTVLRYWSDQENVCVAKDLAPTWLSCPAGSTWNPIIQECIKDVIPGGGGGGGTGGGGDGSGSAVGGVDTSSPGKYSNSILASPRTRIIKYNGGVIPNPLQFAFIFWGSEWLTPETQTGLTKDQIMIAVDTIFRSAYFDFLYQYRKIKRPQLLGSVVNTTFATVPNYKHSDIVNLVKDSITNQLVPANTSTAAMSNTVAHFVISPTGVSYSAAPASNGSFLAAGHSWEEVNTGVTIPYYILGWAIPADKTNGYDLTDQTEWISKMLLGMVTDPRPHTGIVSSIVGSGTSPTVTNPTTTALSQQPLRISSSMAFTRNEKPVGVRTNNFKPGFFSLDNDTINGGDDNNIMSSNTSDLYDEDGEYIGPFIPGKKRRHPFKGIEVSNDPNPSKHAGLIFKLPNNNKTIRKNKQQQQENEVKK